MPIALRYNIRRSPAPSTITSIGRRALMLYGLRYTTPMISRRARDFEGLGLNHHSNPPPLHGKVCKCATVAVEHYPQSGIGNRRYRQPKTTLSVCSTFVSLFEYL